MLTMSQKKFAFIQDKYRRNRGGESRFINLYCAFCHCHLMLYQKDGPKGGWLKRLYYDRIIAPKKLFENVSVLKCSKCNKVIGSATIYKKEDRPAINLIRGNIMRRPSSGVFPARQ